MAILDELKNKIGDKANSAKNIQEAVGAMDELGPLYVDADPSTYDMEANTIFSNMPWDDVYSAYTSGRRVIGRIHVPAINLDGDFEVTGRNGNMLYGIVIMSILCQALMVPVDADLPDTTTCIRLVAID